MKILFINNYDMKRTWEAWKRGEHPGNHLWGITHLQEYGIDFDILPYEKYSILNKIGYKLRLGRYLDQQLRILLWLHQYDLIYSGCNENTFLLAYLRYVGLFKKPIVAIMHCPLQNTLRNQIFIKGHDKLLCLSNSVREQIKEQFSWCEEKLEVIGCPFDLSFYDKNKAKDNALKNSNTFVISAGHTSRDYNTLVKAFSKIDYPLRIYCSSKSAPDSANISSNVEVICGNFLGRHALSYAEFIKEYEAAYLVAIPLDIPIEKANNVTLIGITSLLEAMAMGKAVVMTRNKQIDIDIEKEKIGIWVDREDVEGWQQAISYLLANPQETIEMGNRGRYLCETKYNLELFSSKVANALRASKDK